MAGVGALTITKENRTTELSQTCSNNKIHPTTKMFHAANYSVLAEKLV
jgi:hypothetical protein